MKSIETFFSWQTSQIYFLCLHPPLSPDIFENFLVGRRLEGARFCWFQKSKREFTVALIA